MISNRSCNNSKWAIGHSRISSRHSHRCTINSKVTPMQMSHRDCPSLECTPSNPMVKLRSSIKELHQGAIPVHQTISLLMVTIRLRDDRPTYRTSRQGKIQILTLRFKNVLIHHWLEIRSIHCKKTLWGRALLNSLICKDLETWRDPKASFRKFLTTEIDKWSVARSSKKLT